MIKNISLTLTLFFSAFLSAQNTQPDKKSETKKMDKKLDLGIVLQNGISNADRQPLNNTISDRSTYPRSIGYYNELGIVLNHKTNMGKSFHTYTLSHNVLGYASEIHDTRLSITKGKDPLLSDTYNSYRYFNFSYMYNRYIYTIKNRKIYAGLGVTLNFLYRLNKILYLKDGTQEVALSYSQINNNYFVNNIPTLLVRVSTDFDIFTIKNVQVALTYRKDLHYFLATSSAPIFSAYAVSLYVPIFRF